MKRSFLCLFLVACSTATAAEKDTCSAIFTREALCTDVFIPALVDTRVRLDKPSGIGQYDRKELIATALVEWAEDSKPAAVAKVCAKKNTVPADAAAAMEKCLAQSGCEAFVACITPQLEKTLR